MKERNNTATYKITEIIHKLVKNNADISESQCPEEISENLLKEAIFGLKWNLQREFTGYNKNSMWFAFSSLFYNKNPFGFQIDKIVSPNIDRSPPIFSNIDKDIKSKSTGSQNKKTSSEFPLPDPISFETIDKSIPFFESIDVNAKGKLQKKSKSKSRSKSKSKNKKKHKSKNKNKKKKKSKNKRLKRTRRMIKFKNNRGGGRRSSDIRLPLSGRDPEPWFRLSHRIGGQTLIRAYSLHGSNPEPLRVWGTQQPAQKSSMSVNWENEMKDTFNWFIQERGIQGIISLQACDKTDHTHSHSHSCRWPGYPGVVGSSPQTASGVGLARENQIWYEISRHHGRSSLFHDILIQDMTAGTIESWRQINSHTIDEIRNNRILVHCYAGYGRTGIVLLYYAIRDYFFTNEDNRNDLARRLGTEFFGYENDAGFYEWIVQCARHSFRLDVRDTDSQVAKEAINEGDPIDTIKECTSRGLDSGAEHNREPGFMSRLFITRINYILLMLWETLNPEGPEESEGSRTICSRIMQPCTRERTGIYLYTLNDDGEFVPQQININQAPGTISEQQYGFDYGTSPSL